MVQTTALNAEGRGFKIRPSRNYSILACALPLQKVALHQSSVLCCPCPVILFYFILACSLPLQKVALHQSSNFLTPLLSLFTHSILFYSILGCTLPLQGVALHQCSNSLCPLLSLFSHSILFYSILFNSRLCPSTAGSSPPPVLQLPQSFAVLVQSWRSRTSDFEFCGVWNGLPQLAHSHAQSSATKTSVDLLSWARQSQWE